jgi:hypothetical protein
MTPMPNKTDKPNNPPYAGGEDETPRNPRPANAVGNKGSAQFPVDETDNGPPTPPGDTE